MSKKNALEFDRSQPAFLQRLRGQIVGQTDDPHRNPDGANRPKRPKRLDAEEDEGPTYVMEDTNHTLTKDEYDALVKGEANDANGETKPENGADSNSESKDATKQKLGAIGALKKRKAAKVIGGDDEDSEAELKKSSVFKSKKSENSAKVDLAGKKAPKKKKAKVKIAFGDDEET